MWERASSPSRVNERFLARRRQRRRRALIALALFALLFIVGALFALNQSWLRIASVEVVGADARLSALVRGTLSGSYGGVIPRDSILFFPADEIRTSLIHDYPAIAALSFDRTSFTSLTVRATLRTAIAKWCGLAPDEGVLTYCYLFDGNGYLFAAAEAASTTPIVNRFELYVPLLGATEEPLRATLAYANLLPATFDLARQLATFGATATQVVITNDEVEVLLSSGTRVLYILGNERVVFAALVSAKDKYNLADGSIDYLDVRFDGAIYVKRKGALDSTSVTQ